MAILQYLRKILRKKKPAVDKQRDLLLPTVRTTATIKRLKESGLSDKEIEKLLGAKLRGK